MSERTITALYESKSDADRARDSLKDAGIAGHCIDIHDQGGSELEGAHGQSGFMGKVRDFFAGHEDSHGYAEGMRRGHYLLTAKVDEADADTVVQVLETSNAYDFDQAQTQWRGEGWSGAGSMATDSLKTGARGQDEQVIPIVEEQLRVGKREVERGGVRVRSYIVETPVQEEVRLREERVSVERRAVNQPVSDAGALLQERDITLTETGEEAVVAKDAIVREELVVRKEVDERVEEISETVRRTEVKVEDERTGQTPRSI